MELERNITFANIISNVTYGIVLVDPYKDNFWMNVLATVSYFLSTGFAMFLIWFASIEFTGNFSLFRPVTQQLVSFCVFHVSYLKLHTYVCKIWQGKSNTFYISREV